MSFVLWVGSLMIGLLIFGTLYKYFEVSKARRWRSAPGRVLSSRARARKVRTANSMSRAPAGADLDVRNFAEIDYEYRVDGKTFRSKRISIGEDLGDLFVEQRLAKYPAGASVKVYYNPRNPSQAVLERDAPEGVWRTMAIFIGVAILLLVGGTIGFSALVDALRANLARPERALPVLALAALALFVGAVARAAMKQVEAAQSWPWVDGVIEAAQVEQFRARGSGSTNWHRWRRYFKPDIVYRYRVNGVELLGSRLHFAGRLYSGSPGYARRVVERYPLGSRVAVYYNPANAAEAVLQPEAMGLRIAWALAALLAGGAVLLAFS